MSQGAAVTIAELLLVFVVAAISLITYAIQQKKLRDPDDATIVELDDLPLLSCLQANGQFLLRTIRQSGNPQKDDMLYVSPYEAVNAGVTTFRRANIEYAIVVKNTDTEFVFRRPYHSHRGRQEGKKVGRIEIYKVGSQQGTHTAAPTNESIKSLIKDAFSDCSVSEIERLTIEGKRLIDSRDDDFYFSVVDFLIRNIISDDLSFWEKRYKTYIDNKDYYSRTNLDRLFHWHITDRMNLILLKLEVKHSLNLTECFRIIKYARYVDAISMIAIKHIEEILNKK